MERFEQIPSYPDTYFQLLPSELRRLLALYVYNCNFIINGDKDGLVIGINGVELVLPFSGDIAIKIPQLLNWIRIERPGLIAGKAERITCTISHIILTSGSFRIVLPICKQLIDSIE